jgi:hypothetical protein
LLAHGFGKTRQIGDNLAHRGNGEQAGESHAARRVIRPPLKRFIKAQHRIRAPCVVGVGVVQHADVGALRGDRRVPPLVAE